MQFDEALGARIKYRRQALGISKAEMVRRLRRRGHSTMYEARLREIEMGRRVVKPAELADLCRELAVPPWWLLGMGPEEAAALDAIIQNSDQRLI